MAFLVDSRGLLEIGIGRKVSNWGMEIGVMDVVWRTDFGCKRTELIFFHRCSPFLWIGLLVNDEDEGLKDGGNLAG